MPTIAAAAAVAAGALAAVGAPPLVPVPVGVGPTFQPTAAAHGPCRPGRLTGGHRVHVELFAAARVVAVPAAIGLGGARLRYGRVVAARCRTALWTTDPSGVVRFSGTRTLGSLFRVWGRRLDSGRLLSFRGHVRLYRNGVLLAGDPGSLVLRQGDELVLEVGPYVPPHRTYSFPP